MEMAGEDEDVQEDAGAPVPVLAALVAPVLDVVPAAESPRNAVLDLKPGE